MWTPFCVDFLTSPPPSLAHHSLARTLRKRRRRRRRWTFQQISLRVLRSLLYISAAHFKVKESERAAVSVILDNPIAHFHLASPTE